MNKTILKKLVFLNFILVFGPSVTFGVGSGTGGLGGPADPNLKTEEKIIDTQVLSKSQTPLQIRVELVPQTLFLGLGGGWFFIARGLDENGQLVVDKPIQVACANPLKMTVDPTRVLKDQMEAFRILKIVNKEIAIPCGVDLLVGLSGSTGV